MKTPFRRLMLVFAITVLAVLTAFPLFAAPAPGVEFAVLELKQSYDGTVSLAKMAGGDQLALTILLTASVDDDATQFADNEKSSATLRRVLMVKTKSGVYAIVAVSRMMNTPVLDMNTTTAQFGSNQYVGGSIYQVNNAFDRHAATLDQQPDGAWVITR